MQRFLTTIWLSFYSCVEIVCGPPFKKNISGLKPSTTDFNKHLNSYRKDSSPENRQNMVSVKNRYKSINKVKKYNYKRMQTRKLENMRYKNAKRILEII